MDMKYGGFSDHIPTGNPNQIRINCPFCHKKAGKDPDTKYHCYVNLMKKVFFCHRCSSTGKLKDLKGFEIMGSDDPDINEFNKIKSRLIGMFSPPSVQSFNLDEISWPVDKVETPIAYEYLSKTRNLSDENIDKYGLRVGKPYWSEKYNREVNKWVGRILFPFYFENKCEYIVGRAYAGKDPKYLNSEGSRSALVYNIKNINYTPCIICEGIFSAITAEKVTKIPSVAILGKYITPLMAARIRSRTDEVYLSLDGDLTKDEYKKAIKTLLNTGFKVWNITLPKESDPDDLKESYLEYFAKAERVNLLTSQDINYDNETGS